VRYDPSVVDDLASGVAVLMVWYVASAVRPVSVFVFGCLVSVVA
jgi:hypothetical protein